VRRRLCALAGLAAALCAGCEQDGATGHPPSPERLAHANEVAGDYLDAAAEADASRLCALRSEGAVSRWGGRIACEHRAKGLLLGPYRHVTPHRLKMRLARKGQAVGAAAARVLPVDTSGTDDDARVVVDYGRAYVKDGHAYGGEIIEIDLKYEAGDYRVARVGFAEFAD
jgi:hypothetical protein